MAFRPDTSQAALPPPLPPCIEPGLQILVVDHPASVLSGIARILRDDGYGVESVHNAGAVLEHLREKHIELILLNESLPGVSGLDLLRLLRAVWTPAQLPVVLAVDCVDASVEQIALDAGANDCIDVSDKPDRGVARVRSQLRQRSAGSAALENAERFRRATAGSVDVVWEWNLATGRCWFSAEWSRLSGRPGIGPQLLEEWLALIHPEDAAGVAQSLELLRRDPNLGEFGLEYRLIAEDRMERWVYCRANVERDRDGKLLRLTGLQTDVTRNKCVDWLTQLPNRDSVASQIDRMLFAPESENFAVLMIDVDRFRLINESLGAAAGDRILRDVALRLERAVRTFSAGTRRDDILARLQGDTYLIVLRGVGSAESVHAIAERLQFHLHRPFPIAAREIRLSASIGVALRGPESVSASELLRDAEFALRQAKNLGQARAVLFDAGMRRDAMLRLELELDLQHAIAREQLELHYQPKLDLSTGRLAGFEALLRWRHPVHGLISPLRFIPIAEETGLILPIGWWALETSAKQLAEWRNKYPELDLQLSANLSVKQFFDKGIAQRAAELITSLQLPPQCFFLEVTESVLIGEINAAASTLHRLHDAGVGLMIDDFGTGYSCLNYLATLPFDALKIDRSFVSQMGGDDNCNEVVKTVVSLARTLKMETIAEGIETDAQWEYLKQAGCDFGQGFLFSKPVPVAEAAALLELAHRPA
ncbi:MAG: EAL domain-containing protein [Acidobacteria bacterium]|nr:EAL domain-containing protein [Acidobacteriota bacterium]